MYVIIIIENREGDTVMKTWKEKWADIGIRTLKTFLVAGLSAVATLGFDNWKTWVITFASAGGTAVINFLIKVLEDQVPTE